MWCSLGTLISSTNKTDISVFTFDVIQLWEISQNKSMIVDIYNNIDVILQIFICT